MRAKERERYIEAVICTCIGFAGSWDLLTTSCFLFARIDIAAISQQPRCVFIDSFYFLKLSYTVKKLVSTGSMESRLDLFSNSVAELLP